ncbi:hypothetical protein HYQ45_001642 [Verticillium longisporum]|uniref:Secreted protein n=1 Tax=Verticillium longisporum TaxID=100787 RepID=A0A8I3AW05_VERLO|nr:hypothetical protein HYQ45_001642 [Verticillium longisporum]
MKSRDLSVTNLLFILVVHCSSIDEPLYGGVYPSYQACDTNPTIKRPGSKSVFGSPILRLLLRKERLTLKLNVGHAKLTRQQRRSQGYKH